MNGKLFDELKDENIKIVVRKSHIPFERLRDGVKTFNAIFSYTEIKALLGVVSQKDDKGVKIISIEKESAAKKSGLKKNDIITKTFYHRLPCVAIAKYIPYPRISLFSPSNNRSEDAGEMQLSSFQNQKILHESDYTSCRRRY